MVIDQRLFYVTGLRNLCSQKRKSPLRPNSPVQSKVQKQSLQNCVVTNRKTSLSRSPRLGAFSMRAYSSFNVSLADTGGSQATMVIDYSQTIKGQTSKDAFNFPIMQDLLDQEAENTVFSNIDLKFAYNQIPLHRKDMIFTAFEVNSRLTEFIRLLFGVTNAVAAFKRDMTAFVHRHSLKRKHQYLDDVIIGGRYEEEHQENLRIFLKADEIEGLTLNKARCVFGRKRVSMLGHIVGAGSEQPDPSRIKTLMDVQIPKSSS